MVFNAEGGLTLPEVELQLSRGPTSPDKASEPQLSPDEYLLQALGGHIDAERTALTAYRELAEGTKDPVVELVMGIILEDEERHHALLRRIAERLKDDLFWEHSRDALPSPGTAPVDTSAYESLRSFVGSERQGIHELHRFAGRADGLYDGLLTELLEMMAMDSQKHEHLLRFLFLRIGNAIAMAQRST